MCFVFYPPNLWVLTNKIKINWGEYLLSEGKSITTVPQ